MVDYREFPPIPALREHLVCVWTCRVSSRDEVARYRVLPDNCIDILWHDDGVTGFATGMMTASKLVTLASRARILAVRFKPGSTARFFRQSLHELTDIQADMRALWGDDVAERIHHALWNREQSDIARLHIVQQHLLTMLQSQHRDIAGLGLVNYAVQTIEASNGILKIESLAQHAGVTRQHLASRFRAEVGIPAKTFARICRFRQTLSVIRETPHADIDWSSLAQDCGYFDQSHLIHEFQEFASGTPESFAGCKIHSV
jgi:AraC-like DNA-binding protein